MDAAQINFFVESYCVGKTREDAEKSLTAARVNVIDQMAVLNSEAFKKVMKVATNGHKPTPPTAPPVVPPAAVAPKIEEAAPLTFFEGIALPLAERGWFVAPCVPNGKQVHTKLVPRPLEQQSNDPAQIKTWGTLEPNANVALYAQQREGGLCFLDKDGAVSIRQRYEQETGKPFPKTLLVRSSIVSDGNGGTITKGHWYFLQTPKTIALQNNISEHKTGELKFSFRVKNEYVTALGSIHPGTGQPYAIAEDFPVIPIPDELLTWLLSKEQAKQSTPVADGKKTYSKGARYPALISELGYMWNRGFSRKMLVAAGVAWAEEHFEMDAGQEFDEAMVTAEIEHYCDTYGDGVDYHIKSNIKPSEPAAPAPAPEPVPTPKIHSAPYPVFPSEVMEGTSIYEGFVKPYCAANKRIPYFMWMPTAALMLNYVGTRIVVPMKGWKPSLFLVFIGERDRAHKSGSIKDGMQFLEFAGTLKMYSKEIKNSEGQTIVWEAGSAEGLGTDMQRITCKNACIFYDELEVLVKKAAIEGSTLNSMMLKTYESANFANSIKSKKDTFQVAPNSYVATLITATTDKMFAELWSRLSGEDTGFDSRFTFVLQPQFLPDDTPQEVVYFQQAALDTRKVIDLAVNQKEFRFEYRMDGSQMLKDCLKDCGNRAEMRAEKWALYFAIDLGKAVIDEECIERGIKMAYYERAVKNYLAPETAENKMAGLQQVMVRALERNKGRLPEFGAHGFHAVTGERKYGTDMWGRAFSGLQQGGVIQRQDGFIILLRSWGE